MGNHYTKLKTDYDHLIGRTWGLFKFGKAREDKLEAAVANAWNQFDKISKMDGIGEVRYAAINAREHMIETLKEVNNGDIKRNRGS